MLFMVQMQVNLPPDMPAERADKLKADEKALAQQMQRDGKWRHLWRVAAATPTSASSTPPRQRRAAPDAVGAAAVPVHGHPGYRVARHPSAI